MRAFADFMSDGGLLDEMIDIFCEISVDFFSLSVLNPILEHLQYGFALSRYDDGFLVVHHVKFDQSGFDQFINVLLQFEVIDVYAF